VLTEPNTIFPRDIGATRVYSTAATPPCINTNIYRVRLHFCKPSPHYFPPLLIQIHRSSQVFFFFLLASSVQL
jgi:hypothetical protein